MPEQTTLLIPRSPQDAVAAFVDNSATGATAVGGGTIVVPDAMAGRYRPAMAVLLHRAGLDRINRRDGVIHIGAAVPLDRLEAAPAPLAQVAAGVADREIRAQATVGGNVCARSMDTVPRGDLQVPLIALGARLALVTGEGVEQTVEVERFVREPARPVLVLAVLLDERPRLVGTARLHRPHTHSYTALHVCLVAERAPDGTLSSVRAVAGGLAERPVRLPEVEAALTGAVTERLEPAGAARGADAGVTARDDALASGWYRRRVLPVLVERAIRDMVGTGNGR